MRDQVVKEFKDKPVVFLTIASGGSSGCGEYKKGAAHGKVPALADIGAKVANGFDAKVGKKDQYYFRVVGPDGKISGDWTTAAKSPNNLRKSINKALKNASFLFPDVKVGPALQPLLDQLECRQYELVLPALQKALKSKETHADALKLMEIVKAQAERELAAAAALAEKGEKVAAYFAYRTIEKQYVGMDAAKTAAKASAKLKRDKAVKKEAHACSLYEKAIGLENMKSKAKKKQALGLLKAIVAKFKGTRGGDLAAARLKEIEKADKE